MRPRGGRRPVWNQPVALGPHLHRLREQDLGHRARLDDWIMAKDASFRLIVTGNVGVKEIERLMKKRELDKEILADQEENAALK